MGSIYADAVPIPTLVEQTVTKVPQAYIHFPDGVTGKVEEGLAIPVIDLSNVDNIDGRQRIVAEIQQACKEWGFFQLVNHGIQEETLVEILDAGEDFFGQPMEQRMRFCNDELFQGTRYGFHFDNSGVQDWRDFLQVWECHPLSEDTLNTWPDTPKSFRIAASKYCEQVRLLALTLIALASESLGLRSDQLTEDFQPLKQTMLFNRYLPCPEPDLVLGVRSHYDPGLVNVLLVNGVPGLQMRIEKESPWVPINTPLGALIVNFGDQMQIASNDRYKSFEHRVLANSNATRLSISSFFNPSMDATVQPLPQCVDEHHPPKYRAVKFGEYVQLYVGKRLLKGTLKVLEIIPSE